MAAGSGVLVGRDGELGDLLTALQNAAAGAPQLVLVQGEPGIGKTRLVTELLKATAEEIPNAVTAVGHAVSMSEDTLLYGLATDLLRSLTRAVGIDAARTTLGNQARLLAPLVPGLGIKTTQPVDQLGMFAATQDLILNFAAERPLLLVAEDVHWADSSSLDLLVFLGRTLTQGQILLVVTARDAVRAHVDARISDLRRAPNATWLHLEALADADIAEHMERLAPDITAEEVAEVCRLSDGNPLYIEELIAARANSGTAMTVEALGRPAVVDLASSLSALTGPTARLLRLAALDARPFTGKDLSALAGISPNVVSRAIDEGAAGGVLDGAGHGRWRFHHELLRQAAIASLAPSDEEAGRRSWLAHLSHGHPYLDDLVAICEHWRHLPAGREAFDAFIATAEASERVAATEETFALWQGAVAIAVAARGEVPEPDVAEAFARATLIPQRWDSVLELLTLAESLTPPPSGTFAIALAMLRYEFFVFRGEPDSPNFTDSDLTDISSELRGALPTAVVFAALMCMVSALHMSGHRTTRDIVLEGLLQVADSIPEFRDRAIDQALNFQIKCLDGPGDEPQQVKLARKQLERARTRDRETQSHAHIILSGALMDAAEPREALDQAKAALALLPEAGARMSRLTAATGMLSPSYVLGHWDEVLALFDPAAEEYALHPAALVQLARGQWAAADELIAAFHHEPADSARFAARIRRFLLAQVETLRLETDYVRQARERVMVDFDVEAAAWAAGDALLIASRLAWKDPAPTSEYLAFVRTLVAQPRVSTALNALYGQHARANLARATASESETTETWNRVTAAWDDIGATFYAAESRLRAAECHVRTIATEEAAHELTTALTAAEALGAHPLVDDIRTLAGRARLRLPDHEGASAPIHSTNSGLTEREFEVLQLLAQGRTNDQIGSTLFISPKTASVHVSHILRKLAVSNRTEVVAVAHRRGLLTPDD